MSASSILHSEITEMKNLDYQDQMQERVKLCECGEPVSWFWRNGKKSHPISQCEECDLESEKIACSALSGRA